jgi:hypothetical protein
VEIIDEIEEKSKKHYRYEIVRDGVEQGAVGQSTNSVKVTSIK